MKPQNFGFRGGKPRRSRGLKIDKYHLTINNVMPINCKLYTKKKKKMERKREPGRRRDERRSEAAKLISFLIFLVFLSS